MNTNRQNKIVLFLIVVGTGHIYFDSLRRCFLSNKENFDRNKGMDYFLFSDQEATIKGMTNIPCPASVCPFVAMLKNNQIVESINKSGRWNENTPIFYINTDYEY